MKQDKKELIYWAKLLNKKGFVTAKSGNVSSKIDNGNILITCHDCYLGHLEEREVLLSDLNGKVTDCEKEITSEADLHLGIHNKFKDVSVVLHSHSPYTTAFFHYFNKLDIFSFEARFYLGDIKVIPQETPTVTDIEPVLKALEDVSVVVLKDHGVVATGKSFKEAFSLIELLEEQSKVNLIVRGKQKETVCNIEEKSELKETCKCKMLSKEHREKLKNLINNDKEVQELGQKYDLTCTLAVKNQESGEAMSFHYEKGKIVKMDDTDSAEFVIIGKPDILKKVFNRKIDPFVALTQGKVKSRGNFAKMSKWYPVMVKTFKLWEKVPVE